MQVGCIGFAVCINTGFPDNYYLSEVGLAWRSAVLLTACCLAVDGAMLTASGARNSCSTCNRRSTPTTSWFRHLHEGAAQPAHHARPGPLALVAEHQGNREPPQSVCVGGRQDSNMLLKTTLLKQASISTPWCLTACSADTCDSSRAARPIPAAALAMRCFLSSLLRLESCTDRADRQLGQRSTIQPSLPHAPESPAG